MGHQKKIWMASFLVLKVSISLTVKNLPQYFFAKEVSKTVSKLSDFYYIFNSVLGNKYAGYSHKSTLNLHPQLIQPLHTHRLRGAQFLGEEADAEFF